jgi:hypothetical protein
VDLQTIATQLWTYLTTHKMLFDKRKSSIYKNRSPFSMLLRNVDQQLLLSEIDLEFERFQKILDCEKLTLPSSLEKLL